MTTGPLTLQDAALVIKRLRARLDEREKMLSEPIAIVGVACRLPGGVDDTASFWRLLRDGVSAVTEIPTNRFQADDFYASQVDTPGKMYTRWGGFLSNVREFDAAFFGIAPVEADRMDPQQ